MRRTLAVFCAALVLATTTVFTTGCSSSSSNYQLHNSDGSLNMKFLNDMNNYYKSHPDKLK